MWLGFAMVQIKRLHLQNIYLCVREVIQMEYSLDEV